MFALVVLVLFWLYWSYKSLNDLWRVCRIYKRFKGESSFPKHLLKEGTKGWMDIHMWVIVLLVIIDLLRFLLSLQPS